MSLFSLEKTRDHVCPNCGIITIHVKKAPHYDAHLLALFFSMFLWTPVLIGAAVWDVIANYRCSLCGRVNRMGAGQSVSGSSAGLSQTPGRAYWNGTKLADRGTTRKAG